MFFYGTAYQRDRQTRSSRYSAVGLRRDWRTASVYGVESAAVRGSVGAELDPEPAGRGRDDAGRVVTAQASQYRPVLVTVAHLQYI